MTATPRGGRFAGDAKRIGASRLTTSNVNTFVRARAYGLFQSRVSGSTSTLGRNIPIRHSLRSSITPMLPTWSLPQLPCKVGFAIASACVRHSICSPRCVVKAMLMGFSMSAALNAGNAAECTFKRGEKERGEAGRLYLQYRRWL